MMDCAECERLFRTYSFTTLEIASAILAKTLDDDARMQGEADAAIALLEQARALTRHILIEHAAMLGEKNPATQI